jgi:uncharacterized protein (DUF1499 family)
MRRIIVEEPVSSAAAWSRRIAVFALAVAAIAVAMGRLLRAEPPATLAVFASALALGVVAALLATAGLSVVWRLGRKGAREAIVALLCVVALFAWPMRLAVEALRLPPISDVTTDLVEPPAFSRSARAQAARAGRTRDLPDEATRAAQRSAYADLEPVILDLEPEQAFRQTLRAAQAMGWRIIEQTRPGGRSGAGQIEATDRTLLLGLPDDITIRLRPLVGQTRIDIRSASRYGRHDLGANARRARAFLDELLAREEAGR